LEEVFERFTAAVICIGVKLLQQRHQQVVVETLKDGAAILTDRYDRLSDTTAF